VGQLLRSTESQWDAQLTALHPNEKLRCTWLVPDDKGGGVISVAEACCRQAARAGYNVTLLLALPPTGHAEEFGGFRVASLQAPPPYRDIPIRLVRWLEQNPQDLVVLNGCEEADAAIPFIPDGTRVVYAVHDTAERYFRAVVRDDAALDGIVAVAETVASRFRHRLHRPDILQVLHNGTVLPNAIDEAFAAQRSDDLVFLGADKAVKGAYDVLELWTALAKGSFSGRLHWFGELSSQFRERISRVPGAERIVLHGRQRRQFIFETALSAKLVLMLSRVEPFGMATIECMAMGCTPVAWDIATGTREIVMPEEGLFAPLGDYAALAHAVVEALATHEERFRASTARIRSEFGEAAMWARYSTLIDQIMQRPPAIRPRAGKLPPDFTPPLRFFQLLPASLRSAIRTQVGRSPRLGYLLRDFRGR
jgi:glycosyltransferase involved in cell wall biosynthesis